MPKFRERFLNYASVWHMTELLSIPGVVSREGPGTLVQRGLCILFSKGAVRPAAICVLFLLSLGAEPHGYRAKLLL